MMTEMYAAFKGQPFSSPSGSVASTLALTHITANVEGENATNTATEEPPSHTEGETRDTTMAILISSIQPTEVQPTHAQQIISIISHPESSQATPRIDKRKGIATESDEDPSNKMYWDKEEKIKKATKEAKLLAMSRPEVIKVVREEAKKLRIDPKEAISTKAGETFKKAQDAEYEFLKREHSKKVKRLTELNRRRAEEYMNNDKRNFDVHNPFRFIDFEIIELDELGPIIQKKKNFVVKDLMIYLSKRYERLKKIPEELRIQSALPAPIPEQASSQTSGRKRKHMELEPEVKVPGIECNRSLPEGVPLVNNMVIEEPEYGIFFTNVFGDHAFQRWDDIHKLRKLIADRLDQEKLKSKKVKLEALGYHVE
ncbi:hypothetical protein Tco_0975114 [Tanacetum coccineum]|uniref:Uncharacterized protein n=1 Tax=Tanacetum coccineum TaxID=301880 RepID=A0ABQ5EEN7_9ASTR